MDIGVATMNHLWLVPLPGVSRGRLHSDVAIFMAFFMQPQSVAVDKVGSKKEHSEQQVGILLLHHISAN